jgi:capsular polysaccharide biosynthesis protein
MTQENRGGENLEVKIELTPSELKNLLLHANQTAEENRYAEDEIDLAELWHGLMKRKLLIVSVTLLVTLIAGIVAMTTIPKYESTVLVVPVSSGGGSSGLLAKYGGLASMAGISLPSGSEGISPAQEAKAILTSYRFLSEYIREKELKKVLFYQHWNSDRYAWQVQETGWLEKFKLNLFASKEHALEYEGREVLEEGEPSMVQAVELFKTLMALSDDSKTGLIQLKISWINPLQSKDWANDLVQRVDNELRQKAILESQEMIEYIQQKLPSIELQDLRMIALKMIEEQVKKITFAEVNKAYVFRVIDPAIVAEKAVSPKKGLMIAVGFVLGLMLSLFLALILNWREKK